MDKIKTLIWNETTYRILILPFSYLPLPILYAISFLIYIFIYRIYRLRAGIIYLNLKRSFPEKSEREIRFIIQQYYKHIGDLFVEGVKMFTLSPKQVMKHYTCENPELLDRFYAQKKSVILVSSHYNNWEYMVLSLNMQFKHRGIGVGKRMSNKTFDKVINHYRTRYGTQVLFSDNIRQKLEEYHLKEIPAAYMLLSDQSPNNIKHSFWCKFLNQETGFIFGPESLAHKYNYPVVYYHVKKVRRGYYSVRLELITDTPVTLPYGEITRRYVRLLEKTIRTEPAYWLWSHKRWKHPRKTADNVSAEPCR